MKIDNSKIEEALNFWDETESILKQSENINQEMIVPAISELRYGGRRFVDYIRSVVGNDNIAANAHLEDFLQCCIRARHDAIDAIVSYVEIYCRNLESAAGTAAINDAFPDYSKLKSNIATASKLVVQSREDRINRNSIYGEINRKLSDSLFKGYWELDKARPDIFRSAKFEDRNRKIVVRLLAFSLGLFLTSLAALITVWALIG